MSIDISSEADDKKQNNGSCMMLWGIIVINMYNAPFNPKVSTNIVEEKPMESPFVMHTNGHKNISIGIIGQRKRINHDLNWEYMLVLKMVRKLDVFSEEKFDNSSFINSFLPDPSIRTSKKAPVHIEIAVINNNKQNVFLFSILTSPVYVRFNRWNNTF